MSHLRKHLHHRKAAQTEHLPTAARTDRKEDTMASDHTPRHHHKAVPPADYRARKPRDAVLVVDGDDILRGPGKVLRRRPERHEALRWDKLLYAAKWQVFGPRERDVELIYIQREVTGSGGFYHYLSELGYELRLLDRRASWLEQKNCLLRLYKALGERDVDVMHVGGDPFYGSIAKELHQLSEDEREVAVLFYDGWLQMECEALTYLALGRDLGLMPAFEPADGDFDLEVDNRSQPPLPRYTVKRRWSGFRDFGPSDS